MSSLDIEHILQQVRDLSESDRAVLVGEFMDEFATGYVGTSEVKTSLDILRDEISRAVESALDEFGIDL